MAGAGCRDDRLGMAMLTVLSVVVLLDPGRQGMWRRRLVALRPKGRAGVIP